MGGNNCYSLTNSEVKNIKFVLRKVTEGHDVIKKIRNVGRMNRLRKSRGSWPVRVDTVS